MRPLTATLAVLLTLQAAVQSAEPAAGKLISADYSPSRDIIVENRMKQSGADIAFRGAMAVVRDRAALQA